MIFRFSVIALALILPELALAGPGSFLDPLGPVAEGQRDHLIRVVLVTMIAIVPVLIGVPFILWRYHRRHGNGSYEPGELYRPDWQFSGLLEMAMWGVPAIIIAVLSWWLWQDAHRLDPYAARGPEPLEVQAIGLDWKWLFIYPEQGFATLDELAVPVGRPVRVALTTDTVMQSFRVSALAGQIYAMPGMRTELNFVASRPGTTQGQNMQYNGKGFSWQNFTVRALPDAEWQHWLQRPADRTLDLQGYGTLARAATPAETREQLGLAADSPVRFDLAQPDLFQTVIMRYHKGVPVRPQEQPGSPAYAGGENG